MVDTFSWEWVSLQHSASLPVAVTDVEFLSWTSCRTKENIDKIYLSISPSRFILLLHRNLISHLILITFPLYIKGE